MSDLPPNSFRIEPSDPPQKSDKPPSSTPKPNKNTQVNLIIKSLEKTYATTGLMLAVVSPQDGQIIASNASDLAESWRSLLENNPKVRSSFMKMIESSGWSSVIFAHLMVAGPIIKNHKDKFEHLIQKKPTVRSNRMAEPSSASTL